MDVLSVSGSPNEKGKPSVDSFERSPCPGCASVLTEPFVRCHECAPKEYLLCLQCFANGFESESHKTEHKYKIVSNDFAILEHNWTALEELRLLEGLADSGPGNWKGVADHVKTKTDKDCMKHYMNYYIVNAKYPLPEIPTRPYKPSFKPIPFKPCEDPFRPLPESHRAHALSGYLAARSDFVEEYANQAECELKDVVFFPDDRPFIKSLKLTMVKIYQDKLKERKYRKQIIRKYGLINHGNLSLYYLRKLSTNERELEERLRPIMRLHHPIAHDKYLASYAVADQLKNKINKLKEYRRAGIKTFTVSKLFEKLREERKLNPVQRGCQLREVMSLKHDEKALNQWIQRQAAMDNGESENCSQIIPTKRQAPPIDLSDLPGVEKLSKIERQFCENSRLVPEAYLKYKNILINESAKHGSLRLAQARLLVKIDVNKTRRLFDFLKQQKIIGS